MRLLGGALVSCAGLVGCTPSVTAAATRVLGPNAATLTQAPVCFAPAPASPSLVAQAINEQVLRLCESAALEQGVRIVPFSSGGCVVAAMTWSSRDAGRREATCDRTLSGATCESDVVHWKSVKVTLLDAANQPLAETQASINSTNAGFTDESYFALCSAAFHDYPKPLTNAEFDVDTR